MAANASSGARRNIVVLSDGTGNSASSPFKTNVWRTYDYLDLANGDQIACYDDGVGTSSNVIWRSITGALGVGLQKNVIDLYLFLSRAYRPGDNLYFFGFSRGAFTIRMLIGLIQHQGLLEVGDDDENALRKRGDAMYLHFRRKAFPDRAVYNKSSGELESPGAPWLTRLWRWLHDRAARSLKKEKFKDHAEPEVKDVKRAVDGIKFVGLWDTVEAYGLPIEEMRTGIDKTFFPMTFHRRNLWDKVERACHALALDDTRSTFHPILWEEEENTGEPGANGARKERITQLWFAGAHADVGGGYPDDRLSYVPLLWIMQEAQAQGLRFRHGALAEVERLAWAKAPVHNSRSGGGVYYRYKPRLALRSHTPPQSVMTLAPGEAGKARPPVRLHDSVRERLSDPGLAYAPLSLPNSYEFHAFDANAAVTRSMQSVTLEDSQKNYVLDRIWWRRVLYFVFLFVSLGFLISPALELDDSNTALLEGAVNRTGETLPEWIWSYLSSVIPGLRELLKMGVEFLGGLLPAFARPWIDAIKAAPIIAVFAGALLYLIWRVSQWLEAQIARSILDANTFNSSAEERDSKNVLLKIARSIRENRYVLGLYHSVTQKLFPPIFGSATLLLGCYLLFAALNNGLFSAAEARGDGVCTRILPPGVETASAARSASLRKVVEIRGSDVCGDTGITLARGRSYSITAEDPDAPHIGWLERAALPLRRFLRFGWSDAIVQISAINASPQGERRGRVILVTKLDSAGTQVALDPIEKRRPEQPPEAGSLAANALHETAGDANERVRLYIYRNRAVFWPWLLNSKQPFYADDRSKIRVKVREIDVDADGFASADARKR